MTYETNSALLPEVMGEGETRRPVRGLLAGECDQWTEAAVQLTLAALEGKCAQLTVVAVAPPQHPMLWWAGMAGASVNGLQEDAIAEAGRAAQRVVHLLPQHLPVSHLAVACWSKLLPILRSESYDILVLGGPPSRLRDRRKLLQVASRSGTRVVFG